jgi:hypothetical protein
MLLRITWLEYGTSLPQNCHSGIVYGMEGPKIPSVWTKAKQPSSCPDRRRKMTRTFKMIAPVAVLTALALPAFAQDAAIDINGDGMYSFPELQAVMPSLSEDDFTVLDASGDGLLDADEIAVATEAGLLPAS